MEFLVYTGRILRAQEPREDGGDGCGRHTRVTFP